VQLLSVTRNKPNEIYAEGDVCYSMVVYYCGQILGCICSGLWSFTAWD